MSRREAAASALLVLGVALSVRVAAAALIAFPIPEDTTYYVGVARNLAEGRGLVSDALWSFATPPLVIPRPAFEIWLPLPSLLAAIPVAIAGGPAPIPLATAMRAAQVVPVVAGAVLSVLAWRLAADVAAERGLPAGRARTLALGTGLTTAVYLPLVLHGALPDSTILFGALALGAFLLMARVLADPRGARARDPRLAGIGILLGLAALTRNEAAWAALAWTMLAWRLPGRSARERIALVAIVAAWALAAFGPWAVRNAIVLGTPLPGQAISNAFSVTGFDIFAWNDRPTLERYLAVGPGRLLEMRVEGFGHNLVNVLLLLGVPVSVVGLLALARQARDRALRPLVVTGALTFLVTSLLFPVATTWGTFLHAAAPLHVLVVLAVLAASDAGLARLGARLGWTHPVAWLGPLAAGAASALFTLALLPGFGADAAGTARRYEVLARQLAAAGVPLDGSAPVIHDFPIWLAESARIPTLALPDETPADVLDLATDPRFRAGWLVMGRGDHGDWPGILDGGDPAAACFVEVPLEPPADPADAAAVAEVRLWRIACPGAAVTPGTATLGLMDVPPPRPTAAPATVPTARWGARATPSRGIGTGQEEHA